MTEQPQAPEKITAAELRAILAEIRADMADFHADLTDVRNDQDKITAALQTLARGIAQAGEQTAQAAAPAGTFAEMVIESVVMTYDDAGKPAYKATGAPYSKFGVRIWSEVLPALGIDPAALKPGPNPQTPAIRARVLLGEPNEAGKTNPRKVTGKI